MGRSKPSRVLNRRHWFPNSTNLAPNPSESRRNLCNERALRLAALDRSEYEQGRAEEPPISDEAHDTDNIDEAHDGDGLAVAERRLDDGGRVGEAPVLDESHDNEVLDEAHDCDAFAAAKRRIDDAIAAAERRIDDEGRVGEPPVLDEAHGTNVFDEAHNGDERSTGVASSDDGGGKEGSNVHFAAEAMIGIGSARYAIGHIGMDESASATNLYDDSSLAANSFSAFSAIGVGSPVVCSTLNQGVIWCFVIIFRISIII